MNATNRFLSLIFEELESGLEQVLENSQLVKDNMIKPQAFASEASMILKREVRQAIQDASQKVEDGVFSNIVTAAAATIVALSAYSYIA